MKSMTEQTKKRKWRRGSPRNPALLRPDFPFVMKLPDGRRIYIEVPGRWVSQDRDGTPALLPQAVKLLDQVQALAMSTLSRALSPGYLTTLREALGLTQKEFGERIGVHKLSVSRWERGAGRPSATALAAIEKLRQEAVRRGVTLTG